MTTGTLSQSDEARLSKLARRLEKEAKDFELAGLHERASAAREELEKVQARLREAREARREARSAEWQAEREQREAQRRREEEAAAEEERAAALLGELLPGVDVVPVETIREAAEERGISAGAVLSAARALEVKEWAPFGRDGRVWRDAPRHWTRSPVPLAGFGPTGRAPSL